jgi:hypothetical protein
VGITIKVRIREVRNPHGLFVDLDDIGIGCARPVFEDDPSDFRREKVNGRGVHVYVIPNVLANRNIA